MVSKSARILSPVPLQDPHAPSRLRRWLTAVRETAPGGVGLPPWSHSSTPHLQVDLDPPT